MNNSISSDHDTFDVVKGDQLYKTLSGAIEHLDPRDTDFNHRVDNLRTLLQVTQKLSGAHRLDLMLRLRGLAKFARELHAANLLTMPCL